MAYSAESESSSSGQQILMTHCPALVLSSSPLQLHGQASCSSGATSVKYRFSSSREAICSTASVCFFRGATPAEFRLSQSVRRAYRLKASFASRVTAVPSVNILPRSFWVWSTRSSAVPMHGYPAGISSFRSFSLLAASAKLSFRFASVSSVTLPMRSTYSQGVPVV